MKKNILIKSFVAVMLCVFALSGCSGNLNGKTNAQVECPVKGLSWGMSEEDVLSTLKLKEQDYKTDITERESDISSQTIIYDTATIPKVYGISPVSISYSVNKQMGLYEINFRFGNKDNQKFIDNLNEIYGVQEHNTISESKGENSYRWISTLNTRSINSKTDNKIQEFMNDIYAKSDESSRELMLSQYKESPLLSVYMSTYSDSDLEDENESVVKVSGTNKSLELYFSHE